MRVYRDAELIFRSNERGLTSLVDYIARFVPGDVKEVLVLDRVVGNAAALLLKIALCTHVMSFVGSELAAQTLESLGIQYHFLNKVPRILNRRSDDVCLLEKLSRGKTAEEFYQIVQIMERRREFDSA